MTLSKPRAGHGHDATAPSPVMAHRCLPLRAGEPCGDAAQAMPACEGWLMVLVDGLGHGRDAAHAAQRALLLLQADPHPSPAALLTRLDAGLKDTRGVAAALAHVDGQGRLRAAGVGNISVLHWRGGRPVSLPSLAGVLGSGHTPVPPEHTLQMQPGDWLLLHTDGLTSPLAIGTVLPEWRRDPRLLCDHLLARHRVAHDDAGVLVFHWPCGNATPSPC